MDTLPWEPSDRLARALHTVRMRGAFYCRAELAGRWGLEMPAFPDSISFHMLLAGSCWLRVGDAPPLELPAGGLALVPHGRGHSLLSAPEVRRTERVDLLPQTYLTEHYSLLRHGGRHGERQGGDGVEGLQGNDDAGTGAGPGTQLICGVVSFDEPAARDLVRMLPAMLVVENPDGNVASTIGATLRLMSEELATLRPGGEAVATRLADILVVQAIRDWLEQDPTAQEGWVRGLQDENIGRVLEAIHADPGRDWTVNALARTAAMSRTAFTSRFTELVGNSPMSYLTGWRMRVAQSRLLEGSTSVSALAGELGYRSDAAFTRAFTRVVGQTPGSVRARS